MKIILNPDKEMVEIIDKALKKNEEIYGQCYCPCSLERNEENTAFIKSKIEQLANVDKEIISKVKKIWDKETADFACGFGDSLSCSIRNLSAQNCASRYCVYRKRTCGYSRP